MKSTEKRRPPAAGIGRKKGTKNKATKVLKEALLLAADKAGGEGGLVGYLTTQATESPSAFLALLGKVLPMQMTGEDGGPIRQVKEIVWRVVDPGNPGP